MLRKVILGTIIAAALGAPLVGACFDYNWVDNCHNTLSCPPCSPLDVGHAGPDGRLDECHCEDDAGFAGTRDPTWCPYFLSTWDAGVSVDASDGSN